MGGMMGFLSKLRRLQRPDLIAPEEDFSDELENFEAQQGHMQKAELSPEFDQDREQELPQEDPQDKGAYFRQESPTLARLRQHAGAMPNREDFEPSFGRKLYTGLVGALGGQGDAAKGMEIQQEMANRPYMNAMRKHAAEAAELKNLASSESSLVGLEDRRTYQAGRLKQGEEGLRIKSEAEKGKAEDRQTDNVRADKQLELNQNIADINKQYKDGLIDQREKDRQVREAHYKASEGISRQNAETYRQNAGGKKDDNKNIPVAEQARAQASALNIVRSEMPDSFDVSDPKDIKIRAEATPQERRAIKKRIDELTYRILNRKRSDPPVDAGPRSHVEDLGIQDPGDYENNDEDQVDDRY